MLPTDKIRLLTKPLLNRPNGQLRRLEGFVCYEKSHRIIYFIKGLQRNVDELRIL